LLKSKASKFLWEVFLRLLIVYPSRRRAMSVFHMIILALSSLVAAQAKSDVFLGRLTAHVSAAGLHGDTVDLLEELEKVTGRQHRDLAESRTFSLEEAMRPMFKAVPKNALGNIDAATLRYVLHRLFVQRHGWFVRGLHTEGESWNSSSPTAVFQEHAGEHVQKLFDGHLDSRGFSLRQAAVFAATLESFVHMETMERLEAAFVTSELPVSREGLREGDAATVIKNYMLMYVLEMNHSAVSPFEVRQALENIDEVYPTWDATVAFVNEVEQSVLAADGPGATVTEWNTMLQVLEEVGNRYGRWQDHECQALKHSLMKLESPGTGRVPLTRFYGSALNEGNWQFMEPVNYLRQLGALDESDPEHLSVIIPNYISSPSNCVASSKFYRVCCIDECDVLLSHLETHLASHEASPAVLIKAVAELPSSTVQVPRQWPASLTRRLEDIAAHHGGSVPLHGRLFAQWMHHAYPRECPYPHVSGTTRPLEAMDFMRETGLEAIATEEEMRKVLSDAEHGHRTLAVDADGAIEGVLPWSEEEELFVSMPQHEQQQAVRHSPFDATRVLMMLAVAVSAALLLLRLASVLGEFGTSEKKTYAL